VIHGDPKNPQAEAPIVLPPKTKVTAAPGGVYVALIGARITRTRPARRTPAMTRIRAINTITISTKPSKKTHGGGG